MVKLHLGCGDKKFRGYINIDSSPPADLVGDITALPYGENYADEIMAIHVFEHLYPHTIIETLKHWRKILKPGGKLILEMPDLKKVLEFFKQDPLQLPLTMFALYGQVWKKNPDDCHKWCWTFHSLEPIMKEAGFTEIVEKPAEYHIRERDFRIEATK